MVGLHTYLSSIFVNKGFEIMDMKKCAAIPRNMPVLRKYNTVLYPNIVLLEKKNNKQERPEDVC